MARYLSILCASCLFSARPTAASICFSDKRKDDPLIRLRSCCIFDKRRTARTTCHFSNATRRGSALTALLLPSRGAEYCDERVFLSVFHSHRRHAVTTTTAQIACMHRSTVNLQSEVAHLHKGVDPTVLLGGIKEDWASG